MIPAGHRPEEFSLHVSWRAHAPRDQIQVPGFYLTAGFANEGEAHYVVDHRLLSPAEFDVLVNAAGAAVDNAVLSQLGCEMADHGKNVLAARVANIDAEMERMAERRRIMQEALDKSSGEG